MQLDLHEPPMSQVNSSVVTTKESQENVFTKLGNVVFWNYQQILVSCKNRNIDSLQSAVEISIEKQLGVEFP